MKSKNKYCENMLNLIRNISGNRKARADATASVEIAAAKMEAEMELFQVRIDEKTNNWSFSFTYPWRLYLSRQ